MKENISIEIDENEYLSLNHPQEKFRAFTWVLINGDKPFISRYILNPSNDSGFDELIYSKGYHRSKLMSEISNFFRIFYESETTNFLSEYLLDYTEESEIVKKGRLNQLLKGLILSIDFNWDRGGALMSLALRDKDFSFVKKGNLEELYMYHYLVLHNLKGIYDFIWDFFSVFVNKEQFTFSYFYSNKENPEEKKESREELKSSADVPFQFSRDETLNKLLNKKESLSIYDKYEKKLIREGYLNEDRDNWLKNSASFIRFYNYCEAKNIFKSFFEENSKGVKYIRELYNFHEGKGIDTPKKRLKQNTKKKKYEFSFLNII